MKKIGLLAIALTGLALSAYAPRYYDRDGYYRHGYHDRAPAGDVYYSGRDRYYSDNPSREYHDRDSRYDRYQD